MGHFLRFYPPPPQKKNPSKNQNFEKIKKIHFTWVPKTKIIWDMEWHWQNFLSFWAIFCSFTPLTSQKIKTLRKWKKCPDILSFYTSVPKIMIICYTAPQIWCMTDATVIFHFGLFFPPFYPLKYCI